VSGLVVGTEIKVTVLRFTPWLTFAGTSTAYSVAEHPSTIHPCTEMVALLEMHRLDVIVLRLTIFSFSLQA
jgi:hypothetical protein